MSNVVVGVAVAVAVVAVVIAVVAVDGCGRRGMWLSWQ